MQFLIGHNSQSSNKENYKDSLIINPILTNAHSLMASPVSLVEPVKTLYKNNRIQWWWSLIRIISQAPVYCYYHTLWTCLPNLFSYFLRICIVKMTKHTVKSYCCQSPALFRTALKLPRCPAGCCWGDAGFDVDCMVVRYRDFTPLPINCANSNWDMHLITWQQKNITS